MTGHVPTVLVADDETPLVEMYELFLREEYDVITATDGDAVLELVDDSVDAVVLDRRMPTMSGDETLTTLRERGYEVPVGLVSAVSPDTDIIELPLDAYLTKPADSEDLQKLVELLLSRRDIDEQSRTFLRLASKKAALEATDRVAANAPGIEDLHRQMETARTETLEELSGALPGDSDELPGSVDARSVIE